MSKVGTRARFCVRAGAPVVVLSLNDPLVVQSGREITLRDAAWFAADQRCSGPPLTGLLKLTSCFTQRRGGPFVGFCAHGFGWLVCDRDVRRVYR